MVLDLVRVERVAAEKDERWRAEFDAVRLSLLRAAVVRCSVDECALKARVPPRACSITK